MHASLADCIHGHLHSSGSRERGWMTACAYLHANTSDPLLSSGQVAYVETQSNLDDLVKLYLLMLCIKVQLTRHTCFEWFL